MISEIARTLAGAFVILLFFWCVGALLGVVAVGFRMVAG